MSLIDILVPMQLDESTRAATVLTLEAVIGAEEGCNWLVVSLAAADSALETVLPHRLTTLSRISHSIFLIPCSSRICLYLSVIGCAVLHVNEPGLTETRTVVLNCPFKPIRRISIAVQLGATLTASKIWILREDSALFQSWCSSGSLS